MTTTAIITAMTDGERPFVAEAVRSVVNQTVPCRIVVMVATDNPWIEQTVAGLSRHLTIKRVPLQPAGLVRNLGVAEASTEWVAFLDGDDVWLPEKTERHLAYAKVTGCTAIGARHILIRTDGTPFFYAFARTQPLTSAFFFTRELMLREPFSDLKEWEDPELWQRVRRLGVAGTMRDYLILYRVREASVSSNFSPAKRRKQLFARLAGFGPTRWAMRCASRIAASVIVPQDLRVTRAGNRSGA
jgi:glycosyltransferase involved in cell wall biosynthesis